MPVFSIESFVVNCVLRKSHTHQLQARGFDHRPATANVGFGRGRILLGDVLFNEIRDAPAWPGPMFRIGLRQDNVILKFWIMCLQSTEQVSVKQIRLMSNAVIQRATHWSNTSPNRLGLGRRRR